MPVYNEAETVHKAIKRLLDVEFPCPVEFIVVDDASTDRTPEILDGLHDDRLFKLRHPVNQGKGGAIRTGAAAATGDYIQPFDADMEYQPEEIPELLKPVLRGEATVVFGSRTFGSHSAYSFWYVMGNKGVTTVANILFNAYIADLETCFKLMPLELYRSLDITSKGFGMEAEITGKLLARQIRPFEVPITYRARSREEGKKITWKDGVHAVWLLARIRMTAKRAQRPGTPAWRARHTAPGGEVGVSLVWRAAGPRQAERPPVASPGRPPRARAATCLILGAYLLGAVALTWHLWADPAGRAQVVPGNGVSHDIDLFAWFVRYEATAIAHGRLPDLVTTALNAPQGVNLMWNTSFLLPGVVFAPLTLAVGPQATLTTVLTLGFAGSAATMFWVLRRWGASLAAAAVGGAIFGFSPALRIAAVGHYHLQFAVLLPLMIDALLRLVTGRGRPVRTGAWLGLLTAAQLFIAEESVAQTVLAGAVIVVVLAAGRPRAMPGRVRGTVTGLAAAAAVLVVTSGYPLWVQFHGPLTEQGSPWTLGHFRNHPGDFVNGPSGVLLHSQATAAYLAGHAVRMVEYFAYLGWPMLAVLLLAAACFWRDPRGRARGGAFAGVGG